YIILSKSRFPDSDRAALESTPRLITRRMCAGSRPKGLALRTVSKMRRTSRFRQLLEEPEILTLPGAHDALSARLAEMAGFKAITCGGYAATASLLGAPDIAQLSMTEMAEMYAR